MCYNSKARGCGGIGRRARFRFLWGQLREGSSPFTRRKRSGPVSVRISCFSGPAGCGEGSPFPAEQVGSARRKIARQKIGRGGKKTFGPLLTSRPLRGIMSSRGCSLVVKRQLPKLELGVRFPPSAGAQNLSEHTNCSAGVFLFPAAVRDPGAKRKIHLGRVRIPATDGFIGRPAVTGSNVESEDVFPLSRGELPNAAGRPDQTSAAYSLSSADAICDSASFLATSSS